MFITLQTFIDSSLIEEIIVVLTEEDSNKFHDEIESLNSSKRIKVVNGGKTRQQSVYNGLVQADESSDLICIHDAVRPFINESLIKKSLDIINNHDGVILALPSFDTIKKVFKNQIMGTLPREEIWHAQTPQIFFKSPLLEALEFAKSKNISGTDESSLLERIGYQIGFVEGSPLNIKITTAEDWIFAKAIYNYINK